MNELHNLSPHPEEREARLEGCRPRHNRNIDMATNEGGFVYILRCADDSFYTGTTRASLETRLAEHNAGAFGGHTSIRRPVTLVYSQWFPVILDAIAAERRIKGWSKAKKIALIDGDFESLQELAKRRGLHPSRRPQVGEASASPQRAPQDED